jgi:hypothetical protein
VGARIINNNQGGRVRILTSSPSINNAGVWLGSYLLNQYPGAIAAYSLRKLRKEYSGPVVRVRRDSDNTEQDIGFTFSYEGSKLDTNTLTAFVGSANGFVTKWYDQSGNGLDQERTIANRQPQIVASGAIYTSNGKPAIYFNGGMNMRAITNANITSIVGEWSSFGVIHPLVYDIARVYLSSDQLLIFGRIGQFLSTGNNANRFYRTVAFNTTPTNYQDFGPAYTFTQAIINAIRTTVTVEMFANTVSNSGPTGTAGTPASGVAPLDIGYRNGNDTFQPVGYAQELIHYPLNSTSFYQNMVRSMNQYYKTF